MKFLLSPVAYFDKYIRPTSKGIIRSSISPRIRLGISPMAMPVRPPKADTLPDTRVET